MHLQFAAHRIEIRLNLAGLRRGSVVESFGLYRCGKIDFECHSAKETNSLPLVSNAMSTAF